MKFPKQYTIALFLAFIALASIFSVFYASAQQAEMADQQVEKISSNCVSAKNTLTQLHSSDALLRVNRGQVYELMATKLMNGFNGRASFNSVNNSNLITVTKNYKLALDTFRADYKTYEERLTSTMAIDCRLHPVKFYSAIMETRGKRTQVHADIQRLNQFIDEYKSAILQFEKDYNQPLEEGDK